MQWSGAAAVFLGAGLGACMRWWLGILLNPILPTLPLGTLAANLIGGFAVGLLAVWLTSANVGPEVRLFAITGLLGGLTTFSTFSHEVVTLAGRGQWSWALVCVSGHLVGSLLLTAAGFLVARLIVRY